MELRESLTDCRNEFLDGRFQERRSRRFPQSRKDAKITDATLGSAVASSLNAASMIFDFFAPLRLCGNVLLRLCSLILVLLSLLTFAHSQTRRPMAPADTLRVATVADARISPDGSWIVYTVSTVEGNETRSALWIARTLSDPSQTALDAARPGARRNPPTELLPSGWNASNPRWSPDSRRIAFLSTEKENVTLYVVSIDNRQPRLVSQIKSTNFFITYSGEPIAWSPDGRKIAFISATDESDSTESAERRNDPRVIDRLQYKSRTSFSDTARTHVWVADVPLSGDTNLPPTQLTEGKYYDHALTWNPRGDEIAFLSNHEPDPDANNNSDIFAVRLDGRIRQITVTPGCEYEPNWSPDGKWIAYAATTRDVTTIDSVAEDTHAWVIDADGGKGRDLTDAQDRRVRNLRWSPDSLSVLFLAGDHGRTTIYRVRVGGGKVQTYSLYSAAGAMGGIFDNEDPGLDSDPAVTVGRAPFQITSFSVGGKAVTLQRPGSVTVNYVMPLAFTLTDITHPAELWFGMGSRTPLRRISYHNDALLSSLSLIATEEINFKASDGTPIQGWLMKPAGWREGQRYPLILSIHGGPHGMYGYGFNATFQVYAARGYAVLFINPRGSSGYGQRFSDGTLREWGGGDYRDLMMGVDEALKTHSWIDSDRMGVTGGSYGGFMTNWIVTQTPRFRAAVAVASLSNLISFYSTSLYQDLIHAEFGLPWDDYDLLWRWSPLRYIRQAQTPTLLIHGEQDNDVHITQAEEMYTALKKRGVDTQFVRYPREGHSFREPRHKVDALERTIAWFDRYLR